MRRAKFLFLTRKTDLTETTTFIDLGLSEPLLEALEKAGYSSPTPIQAKSIPPILMGRDLIGIAQTGTGKTAAFVLPMIDIWPRVTAGTNASLSHRLPNAGTGRANRREF